MTRSLAASLDARSDLATRVALCGIHAGSVGIPALACEVEAIRAEAAARGHQPAVAVARTIAAALARGERGPLVTQWLAVLHDAVLSERCDADAQAAFTAACTVRLAD